MKHLIPLVLLLGLIGCGRSPIAKSDDAVHINSENVSAIEGTYKNEAYEWDAVSCASIWCHIKPFPLSNYDCDSSSVEINIIDSKKMEIKLVCAGVVSKTETFNYKLKDGFLVFRSRRFRGVPPILFSNQRTVLHLGLNSANDLTVKVDGTKTGGFILMAARANYVGSMKFKRL